MSQYLKDLFSIKTGGELSFEQCQKINTELAKANVTDIPSDQLENVRDYLISALNHESVDFNLVKSLDDLLKKNA